MPDFDALLAKFDKNGDGLLSADEFPARILKDHRQGLDGLPGADGSVSSKNAFQSADKNQDGKIDRTEWAEFGKSQDSPAQEHGLKAIGPGGAGGVWAARVV